MSETPRRRAMLALVEHGQLNRATSTAGHAVAANTELAKRVSALEHAPKVNVPTRQELAAVVKRDGKLATRVQTLENCLPEVQSELESLNIDNSGFISIDQQVSRTCNEAVFGSTGQGD